jgi:rhamnose transport system substrate-binding protein
MNKRLGAIAVIVAAVAATAGFLASASSGAPKAQRTIGLITKDGAAGFFTPVVAGGQSAATALGDRLTTVNTVSDGPDYIPAIRSLVAQHAAVIAVDPAGPASEKQIRAALARARAAGIPTVAFESRSPGSVWVNLASPSQYARALADALAPQMHQRGQFVIVSCLRSAGAYPIVRTELKLAEVYIHWRYPQMHRVGVAYGDLGNGDVDKHMFRRLLRTHPRLRGLLLLCPGEAFILPRQLIHAHEVGKVFTAGNGDGCPPIDDPGDPLANYVRVGAEQVVCEGDPEKLGYLTVWAEDYLAAGHTFAPGSYAVGGPVGTVHYYGRNQELRLGQPITITKANVDQYGSQR